MDSKKHTIANIILLLLIASMACSPQKRLTRLYTHHPELFDTDTVTIIKDSTVYVDSIVEVHLPADTVHVQGDVVYVPGKPMQITPRVLRAETEYSKSTAWIERARLNMELIDKDTTLLIRLDSLQKEVFHWRDKYENKTTVVEVQKTPKFHLIMSYVGIGIVFVLIALIVLKSLSGGKLF